MTGWRCLRSLPPSLASLAVSMSVTTPNRTTTQVFHTSDSQSIHFLRLFLGKSTFRGTDFIFGFLDFTHFVLPSANHIYCTKAQYDLLSCGIDSSTSDMMKEIKLLSEGVSSANVVSVTATISREANSNNFSTRDMAKADKM